MRDIGEDLGSCSNKVKVRLSTLISKNIAD